MTGQIDPELYGDKMVHKILNRNLIVARFTQSGTRLNQNIRSFRTKLSACCTFKDESGHLLLLIWFLCTLLF